MELLRWNLTYHLSVAEYSLMMSAYKQVVPDRSKQRPLALYTTVRFNGLGVGAKGSDPKIPVRSLKVSGISKPFIFGYCLAHTGDPQAVLI
jgi:hypothetical protein